MQQELFHLALPAGHLVAEPLKTAQFSEPGVKAVANHAQVADVVKCVVDLPVTEGAATPISPRLMLLGFTANDLQNQIPQPDGILNADKPGGDLRVEEIPGRLLTARRQNSRSPRPA